jgi:acyl carrier protein
MGSVERTWTRDQLRDDVLEILGDKVRKLDSEFSGTLNEQTRLFGDLDFESVTLVEFCVAVGKHVQKKIPFQTLVFRDGQFQDFTVGELVTLLEEHLSR